MPNTTDNFNIPFLDGTELVRDYPQFSKDLADAVDAGLGSVGKILQVVRATSSAERNTTSDSFVDSGDAVTITPLFNNSRIVLIYHANIWTFRNNAGQERLHSRAIITNAANTNMSGGSAGPRVGVQRINAGTGGFTFTMSLITIFGEDAPGTTSATTYKARFRSDNTSASTRLNNTEQNSNFYAIEVAG